jgi:phosphatidylserine synthase
VLPILAVMALAILFLVSYPWESLALAAAIYLVLIPVSILSYQRKKREP